MTPIWQSSWQKLPFGYRMELGKVVIHPQKSVVVREIFEKYALGASYNELVDCLRGQDVSYDQGKIWNKNMVGRILENRKYMISNYEKINFCNFSAHFPQSFSPHKAPSFSPFQGHPSHTTSPIKSLAHPQFSALSGVSYADEFPSKSPLVSLTLAPSRGNLRDGFRAEHRDFR